MRRYLIWIVLAVFWATIAIVGLVQHHPANAALEGAVALLFLIVGISVKRRDALKSSNYTASRPK